MRTIILQGGKYAFIIDEFGSLIECKRYGEAWLGGLEYRFSRSFIALIERVSELETALAVNRTAMTKSVEQDLDSARDSTPLTSSNLCYEIRSDAADQSQP